MIELHLDIVEAYLCNGWSHRRIQAEIMGIPAPERGGGYEAMRVLHSYGILGNHKSLLRNRGIDRKVFARTRNIERYLEEVR